MSVTKLFLTNISIKNFTINQLKQNKHLYKFIRLLETKNLSSYI